MEKMCIRDRYDHRKPDDRYGRGKDKYNEYPDSPSVEGTFIGHPKGFGFVEIEGEDNDVFIPEDCTGTAMHQDKVRVIITKEPQEGKRREGIVVKVLERGMTQIVGTYETVSYTHLPRKKKSGRCFSR